MIGVAGMAIIVNMVIGYWLHHDSKHDNQHPPARIFIRSATAASAAGVVVAGVIVATTGQPLRRSNRCRSRSPG